MGEWECTHSFQRNVFLAHEISEIEKKTFFNDDFFKMTVYRSNVHLSGCW